MKKSIGLKGKFWAAMGVLFVCMITLGAGTVFEVRKIRGQVDAIGKSASPLALSSMELRYWNEKSMSTIEASALAARKYAPGFLAASEIAPTRPRHWNRA